MTIVEKSIYELSPMFMARRPMFNHRINTRVQMIDSSGFLNLLTPEEKEVYLRQAFVECMFDYKPDFTEEEVLRRLNKELMVHLKP